MKKKPKRVGGLKGSIRVSNIKEARRRMRGVGPDHGGPGFGKSLRTHAVVRPGLPTGTFAV
jgi:hypothetical protein